MAFLCPSPFLQFEDSNGEPLVGGKLYTYAAGTTTPLATFTDSTGGTPNTNPVILDSNGIASVWLGTNLYYMELKDANDVLIKSADNVGGFISAGGSGNLVVLGTLTVGLDATIHGVTVGEGAGSIVTNTVLGNAAFGANTTGSFSTAIGYQALAGNTTGSNTALGALTLTTNSSGTLNTGLGSTALHSNTIGGNNVAAGNASLFNNTAGNNNTAIGVAAAYQSASANGSTALGYNALFSNVSSASNTAVGTQALFSTTGALNTGVGVTALFSNTTGSQNTAVGVGALGVSVAQIRSTAIGNNALINSVSGNFNSAIGYNALGNSVTDSNSTGLGANSQVTGSNQVQLGDAATTTYAYGAVQNRSDLRDKADIRPTQLGLAFIAALRPVDFRWDMREFYRPEPLVERATKEETKAWLEAAKLDNIKSDGSKKRSRYHHALIAQEVKAAADKLGVDFGGYQDHSLSGGQDVLSLGYEELIAPMIKAIQELKSEVDALKKTALGLPQWV